MVRSPGHRRPAAPASGPARRGATTAPSRADGTWRRAGCQKPVTAGTPLTAVVW